MGLAAVGRCSARFWSTLWLRRAAGPISHYTIAMQLPVQSTARPALCTLVIRFVIVAVCSLVAVETIAAEPLRYDEPYPEAASKKGLQVEMVDDAIELG